MAGMPQSMIARIDQGCSPARTVLTRSDQLTREWGAAVDLVGIDHVGISTDFSFDYDDFVEEVSRNPHLFDDSYTRWGVIQWMPPETLLTLGEHLATRGWMAADIRAVLGGNFYRVAQQSWRP